MHTSSGPENSADGRDPLTDDHALWELLGRAPRPPAPGPFFERRVLRAIANLQEERAEPSAWRRLANLFSTRPRTVWSGASFIGAAAAVMLATGGPRAWLGPLAPRHHASAASAASGGNNVPAANSPATFQESDVNVIANLDELTETNDNHVWLDEDDENAS